MKTTEDQSLDQMKTSWEREHKRGKIAGGLFLILIGGLLLGREFGLDIPYWLISWKSFLIGLGLYLGFKNGYRNSFWMVPVLIGTSFILLDFYPGLFHKGLIWPIVLIVIGIIVLLKPRRKHHQGRHFMKMMQEMKNSEYAPTEQESTSYGQSHGGNVLEFNAFMAGITKTVISKDFAKGEINAILGGAEVNFSMADFQGMAKLEVNAILGGVKLIIPANWEIRSEINCIMGGVEDNRGIRPSDLTGSQKILILEGNAIMGGIEIKSY